MRAKPLFDEGGNTRTLIVALVLASLLALGVTVFTANPDGTESCQLSAGGTCFHVFESTDTTTTADSGLVQWDRCPYISFKLDNPSGAASIFMKECSEKDTAGDCTVFTCDLNGDGLVDVTDEAIVIDGTAGTRGCAGMRPMSRWGWVDVQAVPSSGDARVSIVCHAR